MQTYAVGSGMSWAQVASVFYLRRADVVTDLMVANLVTDESSNLIG